MKIASLEAIPVYMPFKEKVADSLGEYAGSNHGIMLLKGEDGLVGLGEIALAWYGGAHWLCKEFNTLWAPQLIGLDCFELTAARTKMDLLCGFSKRHLLVKAGVEMAMYDLLGKLLNCPVFNLIGGALREKIPITGGIAMGTAEETAENAKIRVTQGYRELKLKVGLNDREDIEAVRAVREVIPSETRLRADANMAWKSIRHARYMMDALYELGVDIIEQPLEAHRLEDMKQLRKLSGARVLIDESVWDIRSAKACLDAGAADMLHVYISEAGGIAEALRIASIAALYDIPCTIGSMPEGCIGASASAHAAAAMENLSEDASDIRGFTVYQEDVINETLQIEDGFLLIPKEPGLGVTLNQCKLERLRAAVSITGRGL